MLSQVPIALSMLLVSLATASESESRHPFLRELGWDVDQPGEARMAAFLQQRDLETRTRTTKRDWSIPTDGLPPSPVDYWVLQNDSSWPILANAGVRRMQTWFLPSTSTYDGLSWWQFPVLLLSYMDLDRALGEKSNEHVVSLVLNNNDRGVQYMIDAYVDDQAWWGLAAAKAYQLYGNSEWLNAAKAIQSADAQYWTADCGGGLLWLTYKPSYGKNTVTNTLQIALSARLYRITGEQAYLDDATKTLDWWSSWAYESDTGKIWDSLTAYDCEKKYLQTFTYNSGIPIGALVDLYAGTQDTSYLKMAQNIAYAAIRDYSTPAGVLQEGCEHDGPPNNSGDVPAADGGPLNNLPRGCQSDTIMFKSILAQNLGYLYRSSPDPVILNFLVYNQLMNAFFNMDSTFLFGEYWGGPFDATLANQLTQANALGLLSAATAVNLARSNALRAASGQGPVVVTEAFSVPLPTSDGQLSKRSRAQVQL